MEGFAEGGARARQRALVAVEGVEASGAESVFGQHLKLVDALLREGEERLGVHGERVEGGEAGGAAGWAGAVAQGIAEVGEGDTEIVEVRAQGDEGAKLTLLALPEAAIEVSAEEVADGFGRVMDGAGAEAGWAWEGVALSIMRAGQGMPAEERGEASSGVGILGAAFVVLAAVALAAAAAGSAAATAVSVAVIVVVIIIAATAACSARFVRAAGGWAA